MKINILDAHDRLQHFHKQADLISKGCQDCIANRPEEFGIRPFYIFAHARTEDDQPGIKRLIWQPRLSKPKAQSNSMLFKCYPPDKIKIIWMLPAKEMWEQYVKGNLTEHQNVCESIHLFKTDKNRLEVKEDDDLDDETINQIYQSISLNANRNKMMDRIYEH